jgi:predicted phage tail protein
MLTVKLYGPLRALCGHRTSIEIEVRSPAEAVRALCVLFPPLKKWLVNEGRATPIVVAGTLPGRVSVRYAEDTLTNPQSRGVLRLVPQLSGAGDGKAWGQVILGAVLVAVGYFTFGATSAYGAALISAGLSVGLGGAAQLIAGRPAVNSSQQNGVNNQPSYNFGGVVNTTGQGGPVPLGYGRLRIGGQVISVGFSTNNEVIV